MRMGWAEQRLSQLKAMLQKAVSLRMTTLILPSQGKIIHASDCGWVLFSKNPLSSLHYLHL